VGILEWGRQVSDQELNDLLKSFDNPNHCYQQRLVDAIRLLVKERDEARREIVLLLNGCCSWSKLTQEIKKRDWECLKEASA